MKEVDRAAIDDAKDFGSTLLHHVADRAHADDHLEVLTNLMDELLERLVINVVEIALGLGFVFEQAHVSDVFALKHELKDIAGVEEVVDEDQELLLVYLAVGDDVRRGRRLARGGVGAQSLFYLLFLKSAIADNLATNTGPDIRAVLPDLPASSKLAHAALGSDTNTRETAPAYKPESNCCHAASP